MAIVRDWLWVCFVGLESCTAAVKVALPCTVGVPEITPELGCSVRLEGSEPVIKLQVYGGVPPLASIPAW
jgi:hypothetical protein